MRKLILLGGAIALGVFAGSAQAYSAGTVAVPSTLETTPTGVKGDTADDPAIWVNQADPAASLVITNEKVAKRLIVFDLSGQVVQQFSDGVFYGNVDMRGDWVVAAHSGIAIFKVVDGRLVPAKEAAGNATTAGEGLCVWNNAGTLYAINDIKDSARIRVQALTDADGDGLLQIQKPIFDWFQPSEGESCVVDDRTSTLYISEEDHGIWKVNLLSPTTSKSPQRSLFIPTSTNLTADIEGLEIVGDTLIASAQNGTGGASKANWLATFDLATGTWLGNFRIETATGSDDCDQTDGIAAYDGYLGETFPDGLFVCQDGFNDAPGSFGTQDFKFTSLGSLPLP